MQILIFLITFIKRKTKVLKPISSVVLSLLIIIISTTSTVVFSSEKDLPKLNLLTENYGKFNYSLQDREFEHKEIFIGGTSTEFVKKLMATTEIPYKMKLRAWSVSYGRALTKPNYGVFSTNRTEARENLFEWVGPIARYELALFAREDSDLVINSIDDIRDLRVGSYKGSAAEALIEKEGIHVSSLANDALNPKRLYLDQIDVWVSSGSSAYAFAVASGHPIKKVYVLRLSEMYLALNPGTHPETIKILKAAYTKLVEAGELEL